MQLRTLFLALAVWHTLLMTSAAPASAGLGQFTITDNSGDKVTVKHGLFGHKTIVKDRLGDDYEHSRSIFGLSKDTKVGILGNAVHSHKGLFGFSKTEGHSILGDTVTSSKNPIYRSTNINLKGIDGLMSRYMQPNQAKPPLASPAALSQGQSNNSAAASISPNLPMNSPSKASPDRLSP